MVGLQHIRHHGRFYSAALAGLALWLAAWTLHWPLPPLIGGDAFFMIYLTLMVPFALEITPDGLRRRAGIEDEGIPLIVLLALGAVGMSFVDLWPAGREWRSRSLGPVARHRQRAAGLVDGAHHRGVPLCAPLLRNGGRGYGRRRRT